MKQIKFNNIELARELFGHHNYNLARIAEATGVKIDVRGNRLVINGNEAKQSLAENLINQLYGLLQEGMAINPADIDSAAKSINLDESISLRNVFLYNVFITAKKKNITPRNPNQKKYVIAARSHDIVFAIGTCGHGKNLPGNGNGSGCPNQGRGKPHNSDKTCRGSRRSPGLSAGRSGRKNQPIPKAPV